MRRSILFFSVIPLLVACVPQKPLVITETPAPVASAELPPIILPQIINAVGHGAMPNTEGLSQSQRQIMAMRASKLDAYRALAEMVYGLRLTGSSTVSAVALSNDSFRVYIEAYLRGARVLSTTPLPGGSYETVVQLQLGGDFYHDAHSARQGVALSPAAPPVAVHVGAKPTTAPTTAPTATGRTAPATPAQAASTGQASAPSSNFYLSK